MSRATCHSFEEALPPRRTGRRTMRAGRMLRPGAAAAEDHPSAAWISVRETAELAAVVAVLAFAL